MPEHLRDSHILGAATYQRLVTAQRCPRLEALGLAECGLSLCDRDFRLVVGRPAAAQALVVLDGWGEALVDGAWHRIAPGSIYLAPPVFSRGYRALSAGFHIGWATWRDGAQVRGLPEVPTVVAGAVEAFAETVRLLWRETIGADHSVALAHLLPLLRLQVDRLLGADHPSRRLERVWQEVDADPGHGWSVPMLAERIGVGPEQFRRLCLQAHGEGPSARLRALRLDRGRDLLIGTDLPVRAIAEAVGYSDPEGFATSFKRRFGIAPRAMRIRHAPA